ncbi:MULTISPECIES: hypothetical protein [Thermodesulfovibrio]|jgi:hypothetical protein|uniref:hypothetical protein n=1 Tax=Thermodesulfovibrio TaxID=28261 RepID=UPI0026042DCC|nr:hypothetical protein [Thermodesulfovibrio sp.]
MKHFFKWAILTFSAFFLEQILTIDGLTFNFSFLLVFLFIIDYFFPKTEQKKVYPSEILPLCYFIVVGLIEDLFQGVIGPAIISKSFTGILLMILVRQLFFNWTEIFKAAVILTFTVIDEAFYSFIVVYFFNYNISYLPLIKGFIVKGLINIPAGLILSWRKP